MSFFKFLKLFERNQTPPQSEDNQNTSKHNFEVNPLAAHEQLLIEKVIELLRTNPESFSARWSTGTSLDSSVQSIDRQILILTDYGDIIQPIEPRMTAKQKKLIKQLVAPIVERDSLYLIDKLIGNNTTKNDK